MVFADVEDGVVFTVAEVAARFRVSPPAILNLIAAGELIAIDMSTARKRRARWRIPAEALNAFQRKRSVNCQPG